MFQKRYLAHFSQDLALLSIPFSTAFENQMRFYHWRNETTFNLLGFTKSQFFGSQTSSMRYYLDQSLMLAELCIHRSFSG
jgi:hypothetical protein